MRARICASKKGVTILRSNAEKTQRMLDAFAYISNTSAKGKSNLYNVLKVFYLSDKLHMERYGRFIFDETYAALPKGPVPSTAYNLLKAIRSSEELPFDLKPTVKYGSSHIISAISEFDDSLFSDSDLECIDEIIKTSETDDLGALSHDSAWEKCIEESKHFMPDDEIIKILPNSELLLDLQQNRYL